MADDIDQWLEGLGLSKYSGLFAENEIDIEVLPDLTDSDLRELDLPSGPKDVGACVPIPVSSCSGRCLIPWAGTRQPGLRFDTSKDAPPHKLPASL